MIRWQLNKEGRSFFIEQGITARKLEVVEAMLNFHERKEIKEYLGISQITLKWHMTEIYKVLNAKNLAAFYILSFQFIEEIPSNVQKIRPFNTDRSFGGEIPILPRQSRS
jgi:DNA-binding NarL/FixJ family response regulator